MLSDDVDSNPAHLHLGCCAPPQEATLSVAHCGCKSVHGPPAPWCSGRLRNFSAPPDGLCNPIKFKANIELGSNHWSVWDPPQKGKARNRLSNFPPPCGSDLLLKPGRTSALIRAISRLALSHQSASGLRGLCTGCPPLSSWWQSTLGPLGAAIAFGTGSPSLMQLS